LKVLYLFILVFVVACMEIPVAEQTDDVVLATVYGNSLYLSEVSHIVPKNIGGPDSAAMIKNYIHKWIQQQVMLHNAKTSLSPEEQDFSRQIEEYRNSLLLYSYERKLIGMNLDTLVADDEIAKYYQENQGQFELMGNIVKFDYVKLPKNSRRVRDFRQLLKPGQETDSLMLLDQCQKYSTDYWLAYDWVFLEDLLDNVPFDPDNEENFLRRTTYTETSDEDYFYLLRINDFKTTDSIPPLAFEKENIRNIILNSRKQKLLERLRQKEIDEALNNKEALIFKNPDMQ
jgi:hypothetical protein